MYTATCYNVMIVSPSDILEEREIAKSVLYRWNELNSRFHNIVFSILGYDINAHADSGRHPQESLNHQLLEQADLIIAIFWTKLGTPTTEYSSGSVEEITKHIEQGKKALIYFSNKDVNLQKVDLEQYRKLQEYKKSIQGTTYYKEFVSGNDFKNLLGDEMQLIANELESNAIIIRNQSSETAVEFTEMEIEVLKIMKKKKQLQFVKMLGGTTFGGYLIDDQRELAEIEEAIDSLENRGFIKSTSYKRNLFDLTAAGYRVCDQLND